MTSYVSQRVEIFRVHDKILENRLLSDNNVIAQIAAWHHLNKKMKELNDTKPALMAALSCISIIHTIPLIVIPIHTKRPRFFVITQSLFMFFSVNLRLWTFLYFNFDVLDDFLVGIWNTHLWIIDSGQGLYPITLGKVKKE